MMVMMMLRCEMLFVGSENEFRARTIRTDTPLVIVRVWKKQRQQVTERSVSRDVVRRLWGLSHLIPARRNPPPSG